MRGKVLSPKERDEVIRMAQGGLTRKRIAAIYGITPRTVWNILFPKPKSERVNEAGYLHAKPEDDPSNPPQWRCRCKRLVIGSVTCVCGAMAWWAKQDEEAKRQAIEIAKEEGWIQ